MPILPQDEAAAILRHYIKTLTERAGLRWTDANDRDMDLLAELLGTADAEIELDSIPPFERPIASDRVTQVFERDEPPPRERIPIDPLWEEFQRWRVQRAEEERYDQVRRMVNR